jgi:alanine racemase
VKRYRPTFVSVDLDAIRDNVRILKPEHSELMTVVKANAYGHGDVAVARAALEGGATWLGVALVEEGVRLREAGVEAPVLALSEFPRGSEVDALSFGLTPTVYSEEGLAALAAAAGRLGRHVGIHIKVDTGMHRVGLWPPTELAAFAGRAQDAGLTVEGIWTHFPSSDSDDAATLEQLRTFLAAVKPLLAAGVRPHHLHAANSAGLLRHEEAHLDLARPGIAVYGMSPGGVDVGRIGLRPALSWRSEVALARRLPAGESISYGSRYTLERESVIATVPVGYADGYSRLLSSRAEVLIGGRRCLVAGTVTMDQILVDCGEMDVERGAEVVLIGRQGDEEITADELAELSGTINYEVVTAIGERVPREYVGA